MPTSKDRVRRMISLVPYVINHQGVGLAELSDVFGAPEKDLQRDLELLFMTGIPPYGPGDLIDVDIEDGMVWIRMADHLNRPLRLTLPEATSLYVRGKALEGTPGYPDAPAIRSALAKIEEALGDEVLGELKGHVEYADDEPAGDILSRLREACGSQQRVDIEYYSHARDQMTERRIDPEKIYWAIGHWYVAAWDEAAGGERMFRVDRVRSASLTGEGFEPRGLEGTGRPLYSPSELDTDVRLLLRPGAFWVAEYYECSSLTEREGALEVVLPTRSLAWVAKLLIRLGDQAAILDPPGMRERLEDLARHTLALYH